MSKVIPLKDYKIYIVFFVVAYDPNTADSVEIMAANKTQAERLFRTYYQPFYEPLYFDDIEIVDATDLDA